MVKMRKLDWFIDNASKVRTKTHLKTAPKHVVYRLFNTPFIISAVITMSAIFGPDLQHVL